MSYLASSFCFSSEGCGSSVYLSSLSDPCNECLGCPEASQVALDAYAWGKPLCAVLTSSPEILLTMAKAIEEEYEHLTCFSYILK